MRYSHLSFFFPIIFSCIIAACDSDYLIDDSESKLVVEGWIENGGYPVVIVTKSLPVLEEGVEVDDIQDYLIRWAKVSVNDGTDTIILTGKYDRRYYPPYIYTTGRMKGKCGNTYRLTVEYKEYYATAETTIPLPPNINGFSVVPCSLSDTLYQIDVSFRDFQNEKNYYQLFTKVGAESEQYFAAMLGSIDDADYETDKDVIVPVYRGHSLLEEEYTPFFKYDDTVGIKFAQLNQTSYHFWYNYSKSQSFSSNILLSSTENLPSNITGGIGYWCGYGAVNTGLVIKECL